MDRMCNWISNADATHCAVDLHLWPEYGWKWELCINSCCCLQFSFRLGTRTHGGMSGFDCRSNLVPPIRYSCWVGRLCEIYDDGGGNKTHLGQKETCFEILLMNIKWFNLGGMFLLSVVCHPSRSAQEDTCSCVCRTLPLLLILVLIHARSVEKAD